ncbi:MAG: hypothetical protein H7249_10215 [Chitinophagaceae bacterium]|nr:hypothetical protein [Oligoflexus sp.]
MRYFALLSALALLSCGITKPHSDLTAKADLPDNYAIKSVCYGLAQDIEKAIKVDVDDTTDVRLCAVVQKDGHLGLDLRYQPQSKPLLDPVFAMVTLQDGKGRSSSEMFQMRSSPYSGAFELYLTDGCIVGSFEGCAHGAEKKMQQFLNVLSNREHTSGFDVSLAFVSVKNDHEAQWDLHNPLKRQNYKFEIKDL